MEKTQLSAHKLLTDYSLKGRLKTIGIGWAVFAVLFVLTRLPVIQTALLDLANSLSVEWISGTVDFIISGLWVVIIPLAIGTVITLLKKIPFDELRIYDSGLGFYNSKTAEERFAPYAEADISHTKLRDGVWIEAKSIAISLTEYGWGEFSDSETLRQNLSPHIK